MFRNWMRFNADDLASSQLGGCALADRSLVLLNAGAVDHGAGTNRDVVVLREHPRIKIGRHVVTHVHLGKFFVELHLVLRDLHSLLECDRILIVTSIHRLCNARVGSICADDHIELRRSRVVVAGCRRLVVRVVDRVWFITSFRRNVNAGHETVHGFRPKFDRAITKVSVEHLTPHHADVLMRLEGLSDIYLAVRRRDHLHLAHLSVNDALRQVKFPNHAQRDCSTTRLSVIHLALKQGNVDPSRRQGLCRASTRRASANNCHANAHVHHAGCSSSPHHVRTRHCHKPLICLANKATT
mmetsp:Transcript_3803/g.8379  ORF Transcript_3803/g.8379 Transcript_3803/m.8379 type:complete len:298 (+) Transcript_3803:504-1397(+)